MVFFVCSGCNESLTRKAADKHSRRCMQGGLSCVDCSRVFYGDDYRQHMVCMSEAEKYEKSLYKGKSGKKRSPQEIWVDAVNQAVAEAANDASLPHHVKQMCAQLADYPNVPRNQKKFVNFVKNSLRARDEALIEKLWNYLEGVKQRLTDQAAGEQPDNKKRRVDDSGKEAESESQEERKEEVQSGEAEEHKSSEQEPQEKVKLKVLLRKIVKQHGGEMKLKELVKAVSAQLSGLKDEIEQTVAQKIGSSDKLVLDNKTVRLK